jgi:hypothetical protein
MGKKMPCDLKKVIIVIDRREVIHSRLSHFSTCLRADRWRKQREERRDEVWILTIGF